MSSRLLPCPHCTANVRNDNLDSHIRKVHGGYRPRTADLRITTRHFRRPFTAQSPLMWSWDKGGYIQSQYSNDDVLEPQPHSTPVSADTQSRLSSPCAPNSSYSCRSSVSSPGEVIELSDEESISSNRSQSKKKESDNEWILFSTPTLVINQRRSDGFKCPTNKCESVFDEVEQVVQHAYTAHLLERCPSCKGVNFRHVDAMRDHVKRVHKKDSYSSSHFTEGPTFSIPPTANNESKLSSRCRVVNNKSKNSGKDTVSQTTARLKVTKREILPPKQGQKASGKNTPLLSKEITKNSTPKSPTSLTSGVKFKEQKATNPTSKDGQTKLPPGNFQKTNGKKTTLLTKNSTTKESVSPGSLTNEVKSKEEKATKPISKDGLSPNDCQETSGKNTPLLNKEVTKNSLPPKEPARPTSLTSGVKPNQHEPTNLTSKDGQTKLPPDDCQETSGKNTPLLTKEGTTSSTPKEPGSLGSPTSEVKSKEQGGTNLTSKDGQTKQPPIDCQNTSPMSSATDTNSDTVVITHAKSLSSENEHVESTGVEHSLLSNLATESSDWNVEMSQAAQDKNTCRRNRNYETQFVNSFKDAELEKAPNFRFINAGDLVGYSLNIS